MNFKKTIFLFYLLLFISLSIFSQTAKTYNQLSKKYLKINLDSSDYFAKKAIELALNSKDYNEAGYALKNRGNIQYYKSNKEAAIKQYQKAILNFKKSNNSDELANIYHNIGLMYYNMHSTKDAQKYYHLALSTNLKNNRTGALSSTYNGLAVLFQDISRYDSSGYYLELAYKTINKNDSNRVSELYNSLGRNFIYQGKHDSALYYYTKSYRLSKVMQDSAYLAITIENIGQIFTKTLNYDSAISCYFMALNIYDQFNNQKGKARVYNNIGNIYLEIEDTVKSELYYYKSLELYKESGNLINQAGLYNNLALIQQTQGHYNNAKLLFLKALALIRSENSPSVLSETYQNLSSICTDLEEYKDAVYYLNKSNSIALQYNLISTYLDNSFSLASIYNRENKTKEAYDQICNYFKGEIQQNSKTDSSLESLSLLSSIYNKLGQYKNAYETLKKYKTLNNKRLSEKLFNITAEINAKYETERIEKENSLFKKQAKIEGLKLEYQEEENKTNKIIIFSIFIVLLASMAALFYVFKSKRISDRLNEELQNKNVLISEQHHEIEQHLDRLAEQKEILETQKDEITDSINYAKRFQTAIIPNEEKIRSVFENTFVLFKPRDIVSGDFYYVHKSSEYKYFVAADCTGHGVPGAFLSIIGHNGLNGALNKFGYTQLSDIIKFLNDYLYDFLHQNQDMRIQDGIDLTIIRIDESKNEISYTGGYNPLIVLREKELTSYKTNKFSVGVSKENIFDIYNIEYKKGDMLYMFSDGYADQFGGPKGKKFMRKKFYNTISDISTLPTKNQYISLEKTLSEWMGNIEQLDDILVAGIQL